MNGRGVLISAATGLFAAAGLWTINLAAHATNWMPASLLALAGLACGTIAYRLAGLRTEGKPA